MKHEALDRSTFESLALVELAAKAIGLKGEWSSTFEYIEKRNAGALIQRWNPLTNNSDALRLAELYLSLSLIKSLLCTATAK